MHPKPLFRSPRAVRSVAAAFGLVALVGVIPANAADLIEATPEPTPIETLPVASWAGPYAGLQIGYGVDQTEVEGIGEVHADGVVGGGFVGYNFQVGEFVYGAEADIGYSGVEDDDGSLDTESGVEGSLRARLGYSVLPNLLVYGTAGGAVKDFEVSVPGDSDDKTLFGYTVGAGTELKFTEQVFGRVEYRYSDYGKEDFDLGGSDLSVENDDHRIQFGVGMSF